MINRDNFDGAILGGQPVLTVISSEEGRASHVYDRLK